MKQITKHFPHYFPLLGVFMAGFMGIIYFSYDQIFQIAVLVAVALSYVIWGIIHHLIHKDLYFEVVLEYLAVATLGLIVVLSLILNT